MHTTFHGPSSRLNDSFSPGCGWSKKTGTDGVKSTDTGFNLSMYKSSISDFKLAKSIFLANFDVSMSIVSFKSGFGA